MNIVVYLFLWFVQSFMLFIHQNFDYCFSTKSTVRCRLANMSQTSYGGYFFAPLAWCWKKTVCVYFYDVSWFMLVSNGFLSIFFWCFNASLLLTCSLFSRPEPASSSLNIKTHHSSQLHTALGWALNTHRINIPSTVCDAVQISRPTFMTHRVVFSEFFFSHFWRARCWWCFVLIANGTIAQHWRNLI